MSIETSSGISYSPIFPEILHWLLQKEENLVTT
jgi:hypothetical protein